MVGFMSYLLIFPDGGPSSLVPSVLLEFIWAGLQDSVFAFAVKQDGKPKSYMVAESRSGERVFYKSALGLLMYSNLVPDFFHVLSNFPHADLLHACCGVVQTNAGLVRT